MAIINNRKIRVVKNHIKTLIHINIFKQLFSKNLYKINKNGHNDTQIKKLLEFYGENIKNKLKK